MKFNKDNCQILHLGSGNPGCTDSLRNEILESSATERDLGFLADTKLNLSQQCPGIQEGQVCPGGIRHSMARWAREGIALLCSELEQPHLEGWGQFWVPQCMKDTKVREHPEGQELDLMILVGSFKCVIPWQGYFEE
ncbi:hypothetical protein TURU_033704 [Turdus rufiventris]|nr:hypothetical protein TURU_033704 [Turdus rufiventris]